MADPGHQVGDIILRYPVSRVLGEGGTGRTYLLVDGRTNLCGKLFFDPTPADRAHSQRPRRFQRRQEQLLKALTFPASVHMKYFGEDGGFFVKITEFLTHQTLPQVLGRMNRADRWNAALCLAAALADMERLGVVSLDLKPDNLMLDPRGVVLRIIDFDAGYVVGGEAPERSGTECYFSPEALIWFSGPSTRDPLPGPPSDMFTAGLLLYEIFSGRRVALDCREEPVLWIAQGGDMASLPGWRQVPMGIQGLIRAMVRLDPSRRLKATALLSMMQNHFVAENRRN